MRLEQSSPAPTRSRWLQAVMVVVIGLLVSWTALSLAGWQQGATWPAAPVPFGMNRVVVVHLLSLLPMGVWVGRSLVKSLGSHRWLLAVLPLVGLLAAAVSVLVASSIATTAGSLTASQLHMLRLAWAAVLMLPWCAAAVLAVPPRLADRDALVAPVSSVSTAEVDQQPQVLQWMADGVISLLFALLPIIYVQQVAERETASLIDAQVNQQYLRAWQISQQLNVLGLPTIAGQPAAAIVDEYGSRVAALQQQVQRDLPSDPSEDQLLTRARQLYSLGRFGEGEQILGRLTQNPQALLRMALSAEAQRKFTLAAERYGETIIQLRQRPRTELGEAQQRLLRIAYERRVNNLRRIGKSRQAEAELLEGLDQWPPLRDSLLLQLAFHYQMAGRTSESVEFFQQAAEVNPDLKPRADAARERLQQQAEGCLLRPTRAATR